MSNEIEELILLSVLNVTAHRNWINHLRFHFIRVFGGVLLSWQVLDLSFDVFHFLEWGVVLFIFVGSLLGWAASLLGYNLRCQVGFGHERHVLRFIHFSYVWSYKYYLFLFLF